MRSVTRRPGRVCDWHTFSANELNPSNGIALRESPATNVDEVFGSYLSGGWGVGGQRISGGVGWVGYADFGAVFGCFDNLGADSILF